MNSSKQLSGRLNGRVVLISGGARGIGRATAELCRDEDAVVLLLDCDRDAGEIAAQEMNCRSIGHAVAFLHADLADTDSVLAAAGLVRERWGRIDVLINNAGIELDKSFQDLEVCDWDRIMTVNLRGAFLLTQAVIDLFPGSGGAIVNVSSIHASHAFPNSLPYACSKAGLLAFTRNLALELSHRHIRVNAVCPGYIDTRLWDNYLRSIADPQQVVGRIAALHPVGRRGMPRDVAETILYLCSESAAFLTGAQIVVDGGLTVQAPQ